MYCRDRNLATELNFSNSSAQIGYQSLLKCISQPLLHHYEFRLVAGSRKCTLPTSLACVDSILDASEIYELSSSGPM